MEIVEHLEEFIGDISRAVNISDRKYNISISLYENTPFDELITFSTLGLNRYLVDYYYEFIFVCSKVSNENEIASFLTSFSENFIDNGVGILQGDIISFNFNITAETKMNSLYFTLPFYFNDDLQSLQVEDKSIIFPLIVPVYSQEAELIRKKGWTSFEEFLEKNEIDNLWDLNRAPLIW